MSRGTRARIDTAALAHNLRRVRELAPASRVWAVVKADGYGHGAERAARALAAADGYAVATLKEAQNLRQADIGGPILLLEGTIDREQAALAADLSLDTVVHEGGQLEHLEALADRLNNQRLWLKVDTGMHRLGVAPAEVAACFERLRRLSPRQPVGLMTHFARADETDSAPTERQLALFNQCRPAEAVCCLANSAGVIAWPQSHGDWVRPGIMLYGASPGFDKTGPELGLRAAMTLTAPVIAVRDVPSGDTVGYGGRWRAQRPSRIATLAIGYGDGYPRHAPDGTPIWLGGRRVPLAGKVSMDMITVDVTDLDAPRVGDEAELWGSRLSVDEVAQSVGTVGYELLTRVSPRVDRETV